MSKREPILVISGLSRRYVEDGVPIEVCIYRLEHEREWSLDAYIEGGDCVAWDDTFQTADAANAEFFRLLTERGASVFLSRLHA